MPAHDPPLAFPVRGVPGGWRDVWDDLDDSAALRARAEDAEQRQGRQVERLGAVWRASILAETPASSAGTHASAVVAPSRRGVLGS